jgi:predicted XRE-type DNA-binding protein
MSKPYKWPSEAELKRIRKKLSKGPGTIIWPKESLSPVDKIKNSICREIVGYLLDTKITQRQLAEKLGENESLISKVVHYNFKEFTIDRLMKFLIVLYPKAEIKIDVA